MQTAKQRIDSTNQQPHNAWCNTSVDLNWERNLETRTKEHFRNVRLNHLEKSAIGSHVWNTGHEINKSATLLKSVNKKNELMNWEKIFIHKHAHHIMNFEIPPESSLIKKYVCRPPDSASIAPTSNATMRDVTLQSIWIEIGRNIARNICLQGKQITLVGGYW